MNVLKELLRMVAGVTVWAVTVGIGFEVTTQIGWVIAISLLAVFLGQWVYKALGDVL